MHTSEPSADVVRDHLRQVLSSTAFSDSTRLRELLAYIVDEVIAGRDKNIKAYSIGVDVFGRGESFDPGRDSIVRVQVGRLRAALERFYETEGRDSTVRIILPRGSYVARFERVGTLPPRHAQPAPSVTADRDEPGQTAYSPAPPSTALEDTTLAPPPRAPSSITPIRAAAAAVALLLTATGAWHLMIWVTTPPPLRPPINSIGLVSFVSIPVSSEAKSLTAEIENELLTAFGNSGGLEIKLAADRQQPQSSSGPTLWANRYAQQLNVRWIVTGELTQIDESYRLNAKLIDGLTSEVVWSGAYTGAPSERLIARDITRQLLFDMRPRLFAAARRTLESMPALPTEALDLYTMANWAWGAAHSSIAWERQRVELARAATVADPKFGPAYAVIADKLAFLYKVDRDWRAPELIAEAERSARLAVELAPADSEAMFNVAMYHWHTGNLELARRKFDRVLALSPDHVVASLFVITLGRYCLMTTEPVAPKVEAFDAGLSPANPVRWLTHSTLQRLHAIDGNFEAAAAAGRLSQSISANPEATLWLAASLVQLNQTVEARELIEAERKKWPNLDPGDYLRHGLPRRCGGAVPPRIGLIFEDLAALFTS